MRFRDHRQVLLKGIDTADVPKLGESNTPEQLATPRWISPAGSGYIAAHMAGKKAPLVLPNRAYVRNSSAFTLKRPRMRGVALRPEQMPWKKVDSE
jgi:hypothetical protein